MTKRKFDKYLWEVRANILSNPEIKKVAEELDFEYKLYQLILNARHKSKMSQAELAEKMGTTQSVISRYEAGGSNPTIGFIQRYLETLGLRIRIELY